MVFRERRVVQVKEVRSRADKLSIEVGGLPQRLQGERKRADLSVVGLEDRAEVGRGTVSRLENNERMPGIETLFRIARVLGINLHWLITGEGQRHADYAAPSKSKSSA